MLKRDSGFHKINKDAEKQAQIEVRDAMMDIYNYAATFDLVPQVNIETGTKGKKTTMTVLLPEHNIKVSGRYGSIVEAERSVGASFKRKAEEYHAKRGTESLIIKNPSALTVENAPKFLDFYKILNRGTGMDVVTTPDSSSSDDRNTPKRAQVQINGEPLGQPVEMGNRKNAEATARLTAAIALKQREPDLYPQYLEALKVGNGEILKPVAAIDMPVEVDSFLVMRETLIGARKEGLPDEVEQESPSEGNTDVSRGEFRQLLTEDEMKRRNWHLRERFEAFNHDPNSAELRAKKAELPMNQYRAKVLDLVNKNVYSIIVGATGSGKTTQVPQILLEEAIERGQGAACNIICTQPRRIAATSVARRVAVERSERLQDSIGYHVRFDSKVARMGGSVTYCTTGILQQQLQHDPDGVMDRMSHLVIDEVHERDMIIDFLLIMLKKAVSRRRAQGRSVPKIVLMSATMDTELFASYFKSDAAGQKELPCPSLNVPGRTFPVKEKYLGEVIKEITAATPPAQLATMHMDLATRDYLAVEDRFRLQDQSNRGFGQPNNPDVDRTVIDWRRKRRLNDEESPVAENDAENSLIPFGLIACTIAHIAKTTQDGAILVFLPGLQEIVKLQGMLNDANMGVDFQDTSKFKMFMLHSSLATTQTTVFDAVEPGCRKIILATNIAETSVTIPDVQYVVDAGKFRETQYDQRRRVSSLVCTWISKSNAKQRAGRAGRVQNGNYYALYTAQRYDSLKAIGLPELLRVDLQDICLKVKAHALEAPIREFLADAIEPPAPNAVDAAVLNLQALDAITEHENITALGRLLSTLPVHPVLGKMIVLGIIFRCLDPMLILGAASSERNIFVRPLEARNEADQAKFSFVEGTNSDHIATLNAVLELRRIRDEQGEQVMRQFAMRNFLHLGAFKTIDSTAIQIEDLLIDAGIIPRTGSYNRSNSQLGDPSLNENSHKIPLIKALALSGHRPNLAVAVSPYTFRTPGEKSVIPHPASINGQRQNNKLQPTPRGMLCFYTSLARSNDGTQLFLRDTSQVTPLMATLFGGKLRRNNGRSSVVELDGWLPFYVQSPDPRVVRTVVEFRKALERLLVVAFNDLGKLSQGRGQQQQQSRQRRSSFVDEQPTFGDGGGGVLRGYLADEKVRELFAGGLVDVLDRDVKTAEKMKAAGIGSWRERAGGAGKAVSKGGFAKAVGSLDSKGGVSPGEFARLMNPAQTRSPRSQMNYRDR